MFSSLLPKTAMSKKEIIAIYQSIEGEANQPDKSCILIFPQLLKKKRMSRFQKENNLVR
jgi:hypothetical protein